jgi:hypothetical protein
MADFTATGRANTPNFTNRIGGEVVMQQEVGFEIAMQRVDELFVIAGAQRGHNQGLSFTTGEQRRAMRAGQKTGFATIGRTASKARPSIRLPSFTTVATQNRRFQLLQCRTKVFICQLLFGKLRFDRFFCGGNSGNALLLVKDRIGARICASPKAFTFSYSAL